MENIVGIFNSIDAAEQAYQELVSRGIPEEAIVLLSREDPRRPGVRVVPEHELDQVLPTSTPPTGEGKELGAAVGATAAGAAGFAAGATAATLMVPGLGLIFAIGLGAAALLGLGGAAAGAKIGETIEHFAEPAPSQEQVRFYRELLQRGRSLVLANVRSGAEIATVREVFLKHGSEDVETARRELGKAA